jgi:hypothetical protein
MSTGPILDRRQFVAAAGAAAAVAVLPVTLAAPGAAVGGAARRATLADWHIDDMWGVYPRPHEAVGFGRPHGDGELVTAVPPADRAFVA